MHNYVSKRLQLIFFFLFSIAICAGGSPSAIAESLPDQQITQLIDKALDGDSLKPGVQGILIKSLDTGKIVYEKNKDLAFLPASNFKLLVSAASLDLLGPDYRMKTSLYAASKPGTDGVLNGDLILVGHGDPVLKTEHLQEMVNKLKEMGIKAVNGNVIGDDSWFDDTRLGYGWAWEDEPFYYSAQISGLNLNENVIDVYIRPGKKAGDPALVRLSPDTKYLSIQNKCITSAAGSENTTYIDRLHSTNTISITGNIPLDYKSDAANESITMHEPTLFACSIFMDLLKHSGIRVNGKALRGTNPDGSILIATHNSPPMSEMLSLLNKPSDNLIAECLFKNLGREIKGKGTEDAARAAESDFLKKIGADLDEIDIADGSGLSRQDLASPDNFVSIISYMFHHKNGKYFISSLPIAGVDGSLTNRMKETAAQGNAKAKTGYINHVSSLSGVVTTKAGENLVFSIIMNNHLSGSGSARIVQDKIVVDLANMTTRTDDSIQAVHN